MRGGGRTGKEFVVEGAKGRQACRAKRMEK